MFCVQGNVFAQAPAERACVRGETLKLAAVAPRTWVAGAVLPELAAYTHGKVPAPGAFDAASLVVRKGDVRLVEGKDYLVDKDWGTLGLGPDSRVAAEDTVMVDYCYSLRRVDSRIRLADGREEIRMGKSRLTRPEPPELREGERRLSNLYVPYFSDGKNVEEFPVEEGPEKAVTGTTRGLIPKTLEKLRAGQTVRIVAWGDSVTEGGDASSPAHRYQAVFGEMLRRQFPKASVEMITVAVGGSNSRQWLYPEKYKFPIAEAAARLQWGRVEAAKPDLVTVEFVNDAGLKAEEVEQVYGEILHRVQGLGAELILITPHFTRMPMMGFHTLRDKDARPYVLALREFASRHHIALADASARWEHLWKEGIPYITLLNNGINHPDDRGHLLFAEELIKCFE
ncbi:MAG: SGNH/GDSL hydrolase family protein [Bryobacterales bacterium]|nr:SGNH/GDSL hydrolase family protein [Bryobacterales bacterium]